MKDFSKTEEDREEITQSKSRIKKLKEFEDSDAEIKKNYREANKNFFYLFIPLNIGIIFAGYKLHDTTFILFGILGLSIGASTNYIAGFLKEIIEKMDVK